MSRCRTALTLFLIAGAAAPAGALDLAGDAAWAERTLRPEWTLTTVQSALDEIAKAAAVPLRRSAGIQADERDSQVTLIARERVSLRQVLTWLEEVQDLHVRGDAQGFLVELGSEERDRRRRFVAITPSDYGLSLQPRDRPLRPLGRRIEGSARGSFMLFAGGAEAAEPMVDPVELADALQAHLSEEATTEVRGTRAYLRITPEEEAVLRTYLDELFRQQTRAVALRVTFGVAVAPVAETGIVAQDRIPALRTGLQEPQVLLAAGRNGQRICAGNLILQSRVADAEVVNNALDPVIEVEGAGKGLDVRATLGFPAVALDFGFAWVEPRPDRASDLHHPQGQEAGIQLSVKEGDGTAEVTPTRLVGGEQVALDLSASWCWQPRGEIRLRPGEALVLSAPHPAGEAVILLEILP